MIDFSYLETGLVAFHALLPRFTHSFADIQNVRLILSFVDPRVTCSAFKVKNRAYLGWRPNPSPRTLMDRMNVCYGASGGGHLFILEILVDDLYRWGFANDCILIAGANDRSNVIGFIYENNPSKRYKLIDFPRE